jgi:antitoxin StbD
VTDSGECKRSISGALWRQRISIWGFGVCSLVYLRPIINPNIGLFRRVPVSTTILADNSVSISELKKNPMAAVSSGEGFPVAVLNHNKPAFYCVPADAWESIFDQLEDIELARIANSRIGGEAVAVSLDDL